LVFGGEWKQGSEMGGVPYPFNGAPTPRGGQKEGGKKRDLIRKRGPKKSWCRGDLPSLGGWGGVSYKTGWKDTARLKFKKNGEPRKKQKGCFGCESFPG